MKPKILALLTLLENHLNKLPKQPLALAFSGGIDSAIVAKLLKNLNYSFTAYVVGIPECHDFKAAEQAAKELKIPLKKIILNKSLIEKGVKLQVKILSNLYENNKEKIKPETPQTKLNPVTVSSNIHLLFVEQNIKENIVVTGLGADTVLGGFYKNLKMTEQEFNKDVEKETKILLEFDYLEDLETGKHFNKQVIMPFIHKDIADFCISLPYKYKIKTINNQKIRKYLLRKLGEHLGLSKELSLTEKKSAQYSSGIMKVMLRLAKDKGIQLREYIEELRRTISKN